MPTATMPISAALRRMLIRLNSVRKVSVVSEKNANTSSATRVIATFGLSASRCQSVGAAAGASSGASSSRTSSPGSNAASL